ncbi:MAG: LuxR C-terminal-related transcriptional regulator [Gaiellaceae bacterium]
MTGDRPNVLEAGQAALARGAWLEATEHFDASLAAQESAEAHEGRALAAWWLEEADAVLESQHAAYRLFQERGDEHSAARLAMRIAQSYGELKGDIAVVRGWMQRAERLLEDLSLSAEHARLAALKAAMAGYLGDRETARRLAREAATMARSLGSLDVEILAMAIEGRTLVAEGDVPAGMALLDEATATATSGEVRDLEVIPGVCCFMITACERIRDFDRAAEWCDVVQDFCRDYLSQSLFAYCRTSYAGALVWWGSWQDAETELIAAIELTAATRPMMVGDPIRRLAELRLRQGRLEEAGELLNQLEGMPAGALGRATLALEAGNPQEAAELAERFLRSVPTESSVERVAGLEALVAAQLAAGEVDGAATVVAELQSVAEAVGTEPLRAAARLAEGLIASARGEHEPARLALEDAIDLFERSRAPFEAGRARLCLAAALAALGRGKPAADELRVARDSLRQLGADREAERAERLLVELDEQPARAGKIKTALTARECEVLRLVSEGLSDREIAAQLVISEHTVHRHVSNIRTKLRVPSRAAAAAQAAKLDLI